MKNATDYFYIEPENQCFYFINDKSTQPEGYFNVCFNEKIECMTQSNDWCYLLKEFPHQRVESIGVFIRNNLTNYKYIDENVIPFITAFPASVHAYAGILSIVVNFIENKLLYKNKKVLVSCQLQQGLKDIIDGLCERKLINQSDIIFLQSDILYKFKSVTIIPNTLHSYFENEITRDKISSFIETTFCKINEIMYERIAIIKHFGSSIYSSMGAVDYSTAKNFAVAFDYTLIEPADINEICLINTIYNSKNIVFSWGTTFMKNFIYISDKCEKITVLIIGNDFINEYNFLIKNGMLPLKYKNATIDYQIVDQNLSDVKF
jgi:hypothetical protein